MARAHRCRCPPPRRGDWPGLRCPFLRPARQPALAELQPVWAWSRSKASRFETPSKKPPFPRKWPTTTHGRHALASALTARGSSLVIAAYVERGARRAQRARRGRLARRLAARRWPAAAGWLRRRRTRRGGRCCRRLGVPAGWVCQRTSNGRRRWLLAMLAMGDEEVGGRTCWAGGGSRRSGRD